MATQPEKQDVGQVLEDDLDSLINAMEILSANQSPEEKNKTFEEKLAELERHPAFLKEVDFSKPLDPAVEGLMQLKYESEDPTAKADAYKEDGNYEFQKKQYKIAVDNYTAGIKCKCPDRDLNAALYSNRAAAQFHIGNYRSAYTDCIVARKFKPTYFKAISRGALCCLEMKRYDDCIKWCDAALLVEPKNEKILEIRLKADKIKKSEERNRRKEQLKERREQEEEKKLLQAIQSRGIQLVSLKQGTDSRKLDPSVLTSLEVHNAHGAKVHLDEKGLLHWPVMFLYPEHTETDYIQAFCEANSLSDHIDHMFGPGTEPPPWDRERKYHPDNINVYFEDKEKEKLHKVSKDSALLDILKHARYRVMGGTPCFILTAADSPFEKSFLKKYE